MRGTGPGRPEKGGGPPPLGQGRGGGDRRELGALLGPVGGKRRRRAEHENQRENHHSPGGLGHFGNPLAMASDNAARQTCRASSAKPSPNALRIVTPPPRRRRLRGETVNGL